MAQEERFGTRDRTYSAWHRRLSVRRFVGIEKAQLLSMIDLDGALYCEFDGSTSEPLALIETALDRFRVRRLWPCPEPQWRTLNPLEWAEALVQIREWSAIRFDREAANDAMYGTQ